MTKYLQVTLGQSKTGYLPKNDLERELSATNFPHLMVEQNGARLAFLRELKNISDGYGVRFDMTKDTPHEIMWSVYLGRANLGTYVVLYKTDRYKSPTWIGAKPRVYDKTRDKIAAQLFADIVLRLNEQLTNPSVNSYSFHLRAKVWVDSIAEMKLPRSTSVGSKQTPNTEDYLVNVNYINDIKALARIYSLFGMSLTYELVEV